MARARKVLIVGGGPGGLTAAAALALKGVAVDLVEISPTGEPVGAAITLLGRAVDAMEEIGVLERIEAEQGDASGLGGGLYDAAGQPLTVQAQDAAGGGARPAGHRGKAAGMYRPVLSRILRDRALALGVNIRLGTSIDALAQDPDGVEVTFSDGEAGRYDLVVGADGIRSKVRAMVFGDDIQPQYAGQCAIRWMAKGPPIRSGPSSFYHTEFGKFLGYPFPKQDLTYLAVVCDGKSRHVLSDEARQILKAELAKFTAPYMVEIRQRMTDEDEVLFRPFEWLLVPDPWFRGRVLLIGDAAHATTAHMSSGGGMAIEDAVVLAQALDGEADVERALAAFMKRRFHRVRTVVETSLALCRLEEAGAPPAEVAARGAPAFVKLMEPY